MHKHNTPVSEALLHRSVHITSVLILSFFSLHSVAEPLGGEITSGVGSIQQTDPQTTVINQDSSSLSINWDSFNLSQDELVQFVQPGRDAVSLNHILDQNPSQIYGRIDANGQVFLMNPNGIVFGESARINVGGLVAGAFSIDSAGFGDTEFPANVDIDIADGSVINHGLIEGLDGASIALIGNHVSNTGQITVRLGKIQLLSANSASLSFDSDGLIQFSIDEETLENISGEDNAVINSGKLQAESGYVVMQAATANSIFSNVVNNTGVIHADRIVNEGGVVRLEGSGGDVLNRGEIRAAGVDGNSGGLVSVMGDRVGILGQAQINVSGDTGGGQIAIGGYRRGEGENTASITQISQDAVLTADATELGDGGEITVWADDTTRVYGTVNALGGAGGGNGGFVELSGKQSLVMQADVDLRAAHGETGTLLLDPDNIVINPGSTVTTDDALLADDQILEAEGSGTAQISEDALEALTNTANVILEAADDITINTLSDNSLDFAADTGSVTFTADADSDGNGTFSMDTGDTITTQGGILNITGATLVVGDINTNAATDGAVTITSTGSATVGSIDAGTATIDVAIDSDGDGTESLTTTGSFTGSTVNLTGGADGSDSLIAPDTANTWTISGLNSGTLNGANFSNFPLLQGGSNDDAFSVTGIGNIAGQIDGAGHSTGDSINYSGASGLVSTTINTDFTNIESLIGGGADHTLIAEDVANTWNITGQNDGTVAGISFTDFSNLSGGSDTDDYVLSGGSVTGTINGNGGTDSLTANNTANVWNILSTDGGNVDSVFAFSSIENLTGGAGTDSFFISGGTVTGVINGGSGSDTLAPANVANTWNITGVNQGNVTGIGSFTNIENLNGRNNSDDFTFADGASVSGSVDGGAGTDSVDHTAQSGAVVINLASGAYANVELYLGNNNAELIADNIANTWTIDAAFDGANDGTLGGASFVNFSDLTGGSDTDSFTISGGTLSGTIDGGGGTDTLVGDNTSNAWTITGTNAGDVTGIGDYLNIENLTGNSLDDSFVFSDASSISGTIDGGGNTDTVDLSAESGAVSVVIGTTGYLNIESFLGNNTDSTLTGSDTVNSWAITGANSGTVNTTNFSGFNNITGGSDADSISVSGGSITGTVAGGAGSDTLIGDSLSNIWTISAANGGDLNGSTSFTGIENLTGNSGTDDFVFTNPGTLSGTIDGGAGADSISYAAKLGVVSVDLSGSGFSNIESFIGNNTNSTLTGENIANSWTITGENDGTVNTVSFTDFNNLIGNDNTDDYSMSGGSVTGMINGGQGTDSLLGSNGGINWTITGSNIGNSDEVASFLNLENLLGGTGDDDFSFNNSAAFTGVINGGTGSDTIDQSAQLGLLSISLGSSSYVSIENFVGNGANSTLIAEATDNVWTISGTNSGDVNGIGFSGFFDVTGNSSADEFTLAGGSISGTIDGATGNDTLIADDAVNTWTISGADTGSVTSVNSFDNIENITGGSLADSIVFQDGSTISGLVDGGADTDIVDYSGETGTVNITIGASGFTNIESFIGNNTNSTLNAPSGANTWTITGNNDGSVGTVNFTDFNNLVGNVAGDNFLFQTGSAITGQINGLAGVDTVNYSAEAGSVTVDLGGSDFLNIETFIGNNTNSTLIGPNAATSWAITGENDGNIGSIAFTNFNNLTGNADVDSFQIAGGSVTGDIDGGAGSDSITADNVANTWVITSTNTGNVTGVAGFMNVENLVGNASTDDIIFNDGGDITGMVNGGAGLDSVDQSAQTGIVNITLGVSGYSNVESFTGNGTNSTLIGDNINNSWIVTGAESGSIGTVNFTNFSNLQGGTSNDSFVLSGGSISGLINGAAGTDQILAENSNNTWNVTGSDVGNVDGIGAFSGIETLLGNAAQDNFVFSNGSSFSGVINGATGNDIVDFSSEVGSVSLQLGSGNYLNVEQYVGNATNSTLIGSNTINSWSVTGTDSGLVNGATFSNFNNLQGNASADTFSLQGGTITGSIDGASGNDTLVADNLNNTWNLNATDAGNVTGVASFQNIDNLTGNSGVDTYNINADLSGNIDGGAENDIVNITNAVTISGSVSGGSGIDTLQGPNLTNTWLITGADVGSMNGNVFSSIENLNGGSSVDTYSISNASGASSTGTIDGGAGDDILNVDYTASSTRTINFIGGLGSDEIVLQGSATGLTNSYVFGAAADSVTVTSSTTTNSQTLTATGIEGVSDTMTADTISLTGTSNADSIILSAGSISGTDPTTFQISGFTPVEFSNKENMIITGNSGTDTLRVDDAHSFAGDIEIGVEVIEQGASGLLGAQTVTFNQASSIGTLATPLLVNVDELNIVGSTSNAYITETDDVSIAVNSVTGTLDLESVNGDITSSGPVIISGNSEFTVANGHDIYLDNTANNFSNTPVFSSAGTINNLYLYNNNPVNLQGINLSGALTIIADGGITQNGAFTVQGNTLLNAGSNSITLDAYPNDFRGTLSVINTGNNDISIYDTNSLQMATSSVGTGDLSITAGSSISQSGAITQEANAGTVSITAENGPIDLTDTGNGFTGVVSLNNILGFDSALWNNNLLNLGSSTTNGGDLEIRSANGVLLSGTTTSDNGAINILSTTGDITLGRLNAGTGMITLTATTGSIVGNNSQITDPNLTAQDLDIFGGNTIGEFNNPIAINISGTSFFDAGDGSANIIGNTGAILPGSILVNNVSFTSLAIGQGQSVSYIVANQDEEDVLEEVPLYSSVDGAINMPKTFE